ncbi:MAG: hypothetical protein O3B01_12715 [Planctomycetota bacterium]|nr:hypothetical protein [Planctomycetota bacterium]MDA1139438.1 hypothetical protein [Planctomycetota bacterium]
MTDLERLVARLVEHEIEFVVVGGVAAIAHGVSVATFDVDVCCRMTETNLLKIQRALSELNPFHRMTPQKLPLGLTAENCRGLKNLYIQSDWGQLDCLGEVAGVGGYEEALQHSIELDLGFGSFRVLDIEKLITSKEAMSRPKDIPAIIQLKAIQEELDL